MLRRLADLEGHPIEATNGAIGQVTDFLFNDELWGVRYIVVQTSEWFSNRIVLISSIAAGQPDWSYHTLRVPMTTDQVRDSPGVDTNRPVSQRYESGYCGYSGHCPYYWGNAGLWGANEYPGVDRHSNDDSHLRSANAIMHYHIKASDGSIGHVQGLLLDEDTWDIRYLVVQTSNWWLGHKVLIAPQWIHGVSWSERTVSINLPRESIKGSPPYTSVGTVHREEEARLYEHYQRAGYWANLPGRPVSLSDGTPNLSP
jgi:hypothetical protein